jgi:hypothetical protein
MYPELYLRAAAAAFWCLIVFYLLPTAVEIGLGAILGSSVYLIFGDAVGCTVLAAFNWRIGVGLYLTLTLTETLLLWNGIVSPRMMPWLTDLVPSATLATMSAAMTISARLAPKGGEMPPSAPQG